MALRLRFRGCFDEFELRLSKTRGQRPWTAPTTSLHEFELRQLGRDGVHIQLLEGLLQAAGLPSPGEVGDIVQSLLVGLQLQRLELVAVPRPVPDSHEREPVDLLDLVGEPPPDDEDRDRTTSFEVRLVDELGEPLSGTDVTFKHEGTEHFATTNGDGVARLEAAGVSFSSVRLADPAAVNAELATRWREVRSGEILSPSEVLDVHFVRQDEALMASLVAKTLHTISLQQDVRLARLVGFHFDTAKSFLLPTALPNIQALVELYHQDPSCDLLIVGHADPDSEATEADDVAIQRAETVAAYLRDDVATWLTQYTSVAGAAQRWGGAEDQLMLKSLDDYPDKPLHENGTRWFQRTRGLAVDGIAGQQTRTQLISEYMGLDGTTLPEDITPLVHSCGAHFPVPQVSSEDQAASDRHSSQEHRRVELFFFARPPGVLPESTGPTSEADAMDYPQWRRRARTVVDLSAEGSTRFVTLLEMADVLFRTNSCVIAPEGEDPSSSSEHASLSTPGLIATLLRHASNHPDKKLLVAGHCDTTGTVAYNQPLSEERAEVALCLLLGDRDRFAALCHARHRLSDYKQILSWVARAFDPATLSAPFDCDPTTIDDLAYTGVEPVRRFQRAYNANKADIGATAANLAEDGAIGPQTWAAMFDCYEHALRLELDQDAAGVALRRGALLWLDDDRRALGFSEHHPIDNLGRDGFRSQANRRVEVLLFDPGEEPNLDQAGGAPEMSDIYLPGRYERAHLDPDAVENLVAVRLCTPQGEPIAGAPYTITIERTVFSDVADGEGFAEVYVPDGHPSFVVEWSDPAAPQPELATYTREVVLELSDGEAADHLRMENLGYEEPTLTAQLASYRAEFARPQSVSDAELRAEVRVWHDGGPPPTAPAAAA